MEKHKVKLLQWPFCCLINMSHVYCVGMNPTCHYQSQYDRMVQEKDAELEEKKKNEMEATAREKSLVPRNMLSSTNND